MRTALSIAGSDSSGGAGVQADLKTMTMNGVFAMSAITALTAQNTTGVTGIMEVSPEFLGEQLDDIFTDIFPDAVKIGMVSSAGLIEMREINCRGEQIFHSMQLEERWRKRQQRFIKMCRLMYAIVLHWQEQDRRQRYF